jgi:hypothetical protein
MSGVQKKQKKEKLVMRAVQGQSELVALRLCGHRVWEG